jgi:hypothetical protein
MYSIFHVKNLAQSSLQRRIFKEHNNVKIAPIFTGALRG